MNTRGKFQCISKTLYAAVGYVEYKFMAVCNDGTPENERFHRYTPSGEIRICVDNPNVQFEPGKQYYVDFSEVA